MHESWVFVFSFTRVRIFRNGMQQENSFCSFHLFRNFEFDVVNTSSRKYIHLKNMLWKMIEQMTSEIPYFQPLHTQYDTHEFGVEYKFSFGFRAKLNTCFFIHSIDALYCITCRSWIKIFIDEYEKSSLFNISSNNWFLFWV